MRPHLPGPYGIKGRFGRTDNLGKGLIFNFPRYFGRDSGTAADPTMTYQGRIKLPLGSSFHPEINRRKTGSREQEIDGPDGSAKTL